MKRLLLPFALLVIVSCNDSGSASDKGSIIGKWKPVEANLHEMDASEKAALLESGMLEFDADGKYTTTLRDRVLNGTYQFNEKDGKLTTSENEQTEEFSVSWEKDILVLKNEDGTVKMKRIK